MILNLLLGIGLAVAIGFFVYAIVQYMKQYRRGVNPDDDCERKPFLDNKGNHCYYDRDIM